MLCYPPNKTCYFFKKNLIVTFHFGQYAFKTRVAQNEMWLLSFFWKNSKFYLVGNTAPMCFKKTSNRELLKTPSVFWWKVRAFDVLDLSKNEKSATWWKKTFRQERTIFTFFLINRNYICQIFYKGNLNTGFQGYPFCSIFYLFWYGCLSQIL